MKITFKILGILAILIATAATSFCICQAKPDAQKSVTAEQSTGVNAVQGQSGANANVIETSLWQEPTQFARAAFEFLLFVLVLLAFVFGILMFRPGLNANAQLLWTAVVLLIAAVFVSPDVKMSTGLDSRAMAFAVGIPVIAAGLCSLAIARNAAPKYEWQF